MDRILVAVTLIEKELQNILSGDEVCFLSRATSRSPQGMRRTHSMRRTRPRRSNEKTGDLGAAQLLLGQTEMDSAVRNLGVELEGAQAISE